MNRKLKIGLLMSLVVFLQSARWDAAAQDKVQGRTRQIQMAFKVDSSSVDSLMFNFPRLFFNGDPMDGRLFFGELDSLLLPLPEEVYFQWDDSTGFFKFPGMDESLILEFLGDSAHNRMRPRQPMMVPFSLGRAGVAHHYGRSKDQSSEMEVEIDETALTDLPLLRTAGLKNSQMVKPVFDSPIEVEVESSKLRMTMTHTSGSFKNVEIRLIDQQGSVVARERVKKITGTLSRSYDLETNKLYFVVVADGNHFFSKKIKAN